MEDIATEISVRMGKKISPKDIKKCLRDEYISELEDRLKYNYTFIKPSSWISGIHNISRGELLKNYLNDVSYKTPNEKLFLKKEKNIRLATYNVHFWADVYAKENLIPILKTIENLKADIVCLQEAILPFPPNNKIENKLSLLGYNEKIQYMSHFSTNKMKLNHKGIKTTDGWENKNFINEIEKVGFDYIAISAASTTHANIGSCFGNAVISNKNMPMKKTLGLTLPSYMQGRSATFVEYKNFQIKGLKYKGLVVISVHLDVFDDSGNARMKQIKYLMEFIKEEYDANIPIMILGDLNSLNKSDYIESEIEWLRDNNQDSPLDFEIIRELKREGFVDVFELQNKCGLKSSTWSARRVDYILVRGIPPTSIENTYIYHSADSDHIPLVVDIVAEDIANEFFLKVKEDWNFLLLDDPAKGTFYIYYVMEKALLEDRNKTKLAVTLDSKKDWFIILYFIEERNITYILSKYKTQITVSKIVGDDVIINNAVLYKLSEYEWIRRDDNIDDNIDDIHFLGLDYIDLDDIESIVIDICSINPPSREIDLIKYSIYNFVASKLIKIV